MGNLYELFLALLGLNEVTGDIIPEVVYCACTCAIVLFVVSVKLIFKGFDHALGYNKIR